MNIIAYSKGGLDARYMILYLDMSDKVASLTTVQTPRHGSKTVDWLLRFPAPLVKVGCVITDMLMKIVGDKKPKTYEVIQYFKTSVMTDFNSKIPDSSNPKSSILQRYIIKVLLL